jgi:N-carbamoyl-L-amino-acid hydrolase
MALDPARTVRELRELDELTGGPDGARRVAWTDEWARAREWLRPRLEEAGAEIEDDAAGNRWATLRGDSDRSVVVGSHLDSVPDGGWLDGALGVLAGLEVLRAAGAGEGAPATTLCLVDWADEEGARFGRSLLGSSAAAGTLDPDAVRGLRDAAGTALPDALRAHGVDLDGMGTSGAHLRAAAAYLELHIEQGPVLEELGLPLGVVLGTFGVERHTITLRGQAAHSGSTPMHLRRDPFLAGARLALAAREGAGEHGGVATVGRVALAPGIPTAVPGRCDLMLDQRHLEAEALAAMLAGAQAACERIAAEEEVEAEWSATFRRAPQPFDKRLVELAEDAVREAAGESHRLPSGPLHDATEVAGAGVPTVMVFVQSLRGLSHAKEEDSRPEHVELGVRALHGLVSRVVDEVGAGRL